MIIRILKTNTPLALCEVEVYAERRGMMHINLHLLGCYFLPYPPFGHSTCTQYLVNLTKLTLGILKSHVF